MSGSRYQRYVKCPFYRRDDGKVQIGCEGLTDGGVINLRFKNKEQYLLHLKTYCCNRVEYCELYNMLKGKYEE